MEDNNNINPNDTYIDIQNETPATDNVSNVTDNVSNATDNVSNVTDSVSATANETAAPVTPQNVYQQNQGGYNVNSYSNPNVNQGYYYGNPYANPNAANQGYYQGNPYQNVYQQNQAYYNAGYGQTYTQQPEKKAKGNGFAKFLRVVALALIFGIIAGGSFYGITRVMDLLMPAESKASTVSTTENGTNIPATTIVSSGHLDGTCVSDIVEKSMGFTVAVNCTFTTSSWFGQYTTAGSGTGIIVGTNEKELLIVTNNHVVNSAKTISVVFVDGTEISALEKGTDTKADLAVIAVNLSDISKETMEAINFATLGDSNDVRVGEMVVAIGNALGYGQSVTVGYISAKERQVTVDDVTMTLLQTDAAINPGNSGGALVNLKGEVIGINSVKYADESVEGMGFSIPVSNVKDIIERLMNSLSADEKGYLGVYIIDITEEMADFYNWPVGVYVKEFTADSAAEAAGIQIRDIITAINGVKVSTSDEMISLVTSNRVGTTIKVEVQRSVDGVFKTMEFDVVLGKKVEATPTPSPSPSRRP